MNAFEKTGTDIDKAGPGIEKTETVNKKTEPGIEIF